MDVSSNIKNVKEMLDGNHPRNKDNGDKLDIILKYIQDMEDFKRKWEGTLKLIKIGSSSLKYKEGDFCGN
jgi:hypothetical protein